MAVEQLKKLLTRQNEKLVDLKGIEDGAFHVGQPVPMESRSNVFPMEQLVEEFVYDLRKQDVKLKESTWQRFIKYHDNNMVGNGYQSRQGQIGLEALALHAKMSASELYRSSAGHLAESADQLRCRDEMVERRIVSALKSLESEDFSCKVDRRSDLDVKMKQFLTSKSAIGILVNVITDLIKPQGSYKVTSENIAARIRGAKIHVCQKLGYLKGCVLRDGWLICEGRLAGNTENDTDRYWADAFTLAIHEAAHFCVRESFGNFGFQSPTSEIVKEDENRCRTDPMYPKKNLELGRAAEMMIFGGLPNGFQVDWELSERAAATDFLERASNGRLPYDSRETCINLGMVEARFISVSFGGKMISELEMPYAI